MTITHRQLEAFDAVMSAGAITRAAAKLGISQPAISRMIADLEATVGFALFLRSARSMVPTERARTLHLEVQRSFLGIGHIAGIAAGLKERGEGQLRLGVVPSLLPVISSALIAPFAASHPAASISIEVVATLNALDWASFRQTDLGITHEPMAGAGLTTTSIGHTQAVCVVPCGHRLTQLQRAVGASDLLDDPFISYKPDSSFRADIDRIFSAQGHSRDLRFEARTSAAVCELVAALGAVAIVPSPGPHLSADARLATLSFTPRLLSDVVLVQPAGGASSAIAKAFMAFACDRRIDFGAGVTFAPE
jgi:DNA-binding transcriptional LysR family regulator